MIMYMPANPVNYNNTILYKIEHTTQPELFYIGHTTQFNKAKNRLSTLMKTPATTGKYRRLYNMVSENGGFSEFNYLEVKKFPCSDANEADAEAFKITNEMKRNFEDEKARKEAQRQLTPLKFKYGDNIVFMSPI